MFLDPTKFTVVCGQEVVDHIREIRDRDVRPGSDLSLVAHQKNVAREGYLGAEIVKSNYGHSVRYDSGLQNFGLLASSRRREVDGTYESALAWVTAWQARDPARRYAWVRKT